MKTRTFARVASHLVAILAFAVALLLALPAAAQETSSPADEAPIASHHRVELNSASHEELMSVPGIGPALAQRIIEAREVRPFRNPRELVRVKGIGPKTMERLLPYVRAEHPGADGTQGHRRSP